MSSWLRASVAQLMARRVSFARGGGEGVSFAERAHLTRGIGAPEDPLAPPHQGRDAEARRVGDLVDPAAVPDRDDPTRRAAADVDVRLHSDHQPCIIATLHVKNVHAGEVEKGVGPGAPPRARDHT